MYVYFETRQNDQWGDLAIQLSIAKMIHERIHEQYVEPECSHVKDMHMVLSNICIFFLSIKCCACMTEASCLSIYLSFQFSAGLPSSHALPDFPSPFDLDEAPYEPGM